MVAAQDALVLILGVQNLLAVDLSVQQDIQPRQFKL
jgi:hypothetical protein